MPDAWIRQRGDPALSWPWSARRPCASLLQHEIDHLDGVLTLDRAAPAERRRAIALLLGAARVAA